MLDDSGHIKKREASRRHRRRVQKSRALPPQDIWESEPREVDLFLEPHRKGGARPKKRKNWLKGFLQVVIALALGLSIPFLIKWSMDRKGVSPQKHSGIPLVELMIHTDGTLTNEEVSRQSGIRVGVPISARDLPKIKDKIAQSPRVDSVTLNQTAADRLSITIREKVAVAWLSSPSHSIKPLREEGFLLDRNGMLLDCRILNESIMNLPTIEVNAIAVPQEGMVIQSPIVTEALFLIESGESLFKDFGIVLKDVRPLGNWGLLCRYSGDLMATFDLERVEGGLEVFRQILKKTGNSEKQLATVNLAVTKNIPITFHSKSPPQM